MSNDSPVVNGEITDGVSDLTTDASVDMVVSTIQDHNHISCGKKVPGELDPFKSQDGKNPLALSYSCEYDHMYANLTDGTTLPKANIEVKHLKGLLLLHLDLIQQQSEQLVEKDKQLSSLRQENDLLRQRLERMDRRTSLHKRREVLSDVYSPTSTTGDNIMLQSTPLQYSSPSSSIILAIQPEEIKQEITAEMLLENLENMDNSMVTVKQELLTPNSETMEASTSSPTCYNAKRKSKDDREDVESDRVSNASQRRKRAVSWTSSAHSDMVSDASRTSKETKQIQPLENKRTRKKAKISATPVKNDVSKNKVMLTTSDPYYTYIGDADGYWGEDEPELNGHKELETAVQVPSWRLKSYSSCYTMEGTENLGDDVFNKRHLRHEIDERRRKRWDVQRIREQRQVEKLKQRESLRRSSIAAKVKDGSEPQKVHSFWPHLDDVEVLEVTDTLPVAAFGLPITEFPDSEFSLPWLMYVKSRRKQAAAATAKTVRRRNTAAKSRR